MFVASEAQSCDFPSYRGILLDILPGGRERVQPFDTSRKREEVRAIVPVQQWELTIVKGRIGGCAWGCDDDFRRAGVRSCLRQRSLVRPWFDARGVRVVLNVDLSLPCGGILGSCS